MHAKSEGFAEGNAVCNPFTRCVSHSLMSNSAQIPEFLWASRLCGPPQSALPNLKSRGGTLNKPLQRPPALWEMLSSFKPEQCVRNPPNRSAPPRLQVRWSSLNIVSLLLSESSSFVTVRRVFRTNPTLFPLPIGQSAPKGHGYEVPTHPRKKLLPFSGRSFILEATFGFLCLARA